MNLPLNIDFQQIFLHLLNFVILAGGLYFLLYGPVKRFMEKRENEFAAREKAAEDGIKNAEEIKAEYEKRLADAEKEIAAARAEAETKNLEAKEKAIEEAKAAADDIIVSARKEALGEKDRIMTEARREISKIASEATEKLLSQSASDAFDTFLDDAERGNGNDR